MKIYASHKNFVCELPDGKVHILNWKALGYYLKHVLKLEQSQRTEIKRQLDINGRIELERAS